MFSQKKQIQYFLVSKNDTLIKTQLATKANQYEGYLIINEKKTIKKAIRPSNLAGKDILKDSFEEIYFSFNRNNDTIVGKSYYDKLNIIKTRREFLQINKQIDETRNEFIFIEPVDCEKFILRRVTPIIFE
jgi:hypothetical protein